MWVSLVYSTTNLIELTNGFIYLECYCLRRDRFYHQKDQEGEEESLGPLESGRTGSSITIT